MGLEFAQFRHDEQKTGMRAVGDAGPYKGMRIGKPLRLAALGTSPCKGGMRGYALGTSPCRGGMRGYVLDTSPLYAFG